MPVVWKEEAVVFVRDRARVERTALGIAGGQNKVVEAAQDEASPTTLPGESPEAKNLLLGEGQSLLRFLILEGICFLSTCCTYRVDSFQARSAAWVPTLGY